MRSMTLLNFKKNYAECKDKDGDINTRAEINKIKSRKIIEKISENESWFFERINKIDKPQVRLIKQKKKENTNKIRNERLQPNTTEIRRIIREYYKQLYAKNW